MESRPKRKIDSSEEDGANDFVATTPQTTGEDEGESFGVGGITLQGIVGSVQKVFSRRTADNGKKEPSSKRRRISPSEAASRLGLIVGDNDSVGLEQISGQSDSTSASGVGPTSAAVPSPPGSAFNSRVLFGGVDESGTKAPAPNRRLLHHKQRSPVPRLDLRSPVNSDVTNRDNANEKEGVQSRGSRVRFQDNDTSSTTSSAVGEVETGLPQRGSNSLTPYVDRQPDSSRRKGTPAPLSFRRKVLFGQSDDGKATEEKASPGASSSQKLSAETNAADQKRSDASSSALVPGVDRQLLPFRPGSQMKLDHLSRLESRSSEPLSFTYRPRRPWSNTVLHQSTSAMSKRQKTRSTKTSKSFNARTAARIAEMASDTLFPSRPAESPEPLGALLPVRNSTSKAESAVTMNRTFGSNQSGTRLPPAPTLSHSPLVSSSADGASQPAIARPAAPSLLRTSTETVPSKSVAFAPDVARTPKNSASGQGAKMTRRATPMFSRNGASESYSPTSQEDIETDVMQRTPVFLGRSVPRDGEGRPISERLGESLPREVVQEASQNISRLEAFMTENPVFPSKGVPASLVDGISDTTKEERRVRFMEATEDVNAKDTSPASETASAIQSRIQTPYPKKATKEESQKEKDTSSLPFNSFPLTHQAPSSSFKPRKDHKPASSTSGSSPVAASPKKTDVSTTGGSLWDANMFGNPDEWKCPQCMVRNPKDAMKCLACEAPKPGLPKSSEAPTPSTKLTFGSSIATSTVQGSSSFIFGEAAPVPQTGISLESQDEKKEGTEPRQDVMAQQSEPLGIKAKTEATPKFTFGTVGPKVEEASTGNMQSTGFTFGKPSTEDSVGTGSSFTGFVFDGSAKPNATSHPKEGNDASSASDGNGSKAPALEKVTKPLWSDTSSVAEISERKKKRTLDEPAPDSNGSNPSSKSNNGFLVSYGNTDQNAPVSAGKKFQFGSPTGNIPVPSADAATTSTSFPSFAAADPLTPKPTSESVAKSTLGSVPASSAGSGNFQFGGGGPLQFGGGGSFSTTNSDGRASKKRINEQSTKPVGGTGQSNQIPLPTVPDDQSTSAPTFSFGTAKSTPSHSVNGSSGGSSAPSSQVSADFSFGKQTSAAGPAAFTFGTTAPTAPNTAAGSFGASNPGAPVPSTNFTFGTSAAPAPSVSTPGFSFDGAAPTTPAAPSTQGALFGGPVPPTTAPPSFSGGASAGAGVPPGFAFGAGGSAGFSASSTGFSTPGPSSGGVGMSGGGFSIGTGGTSTGKRRIVKARRPPGTKGLPQ